MLFRVIKLPSEDMVTVVLNFLNTSGTVAVVVVVVVVVLSFLQPVFTVEKSNAVSAKEIKGFIIVWFKSKTKMGLKTCGV